MKMIAIQTVKVGGKYVAPGGEFELDGDEAKGLIDLGAAEQKTRRVADDGDDDKGQTARDATTAKRA